MRVTIPETYREIDIPNGTVKDRWLAVWPENLEPNATILFGHESGATVLRDGANIAFHVPWDGIKFSEYRYMVGLK